ncbi:hypothetical protein Q1695_003202 [Nippostrongylus brasiliensis]|nr:hypothetical protein Q1695_003202 [Nippostrongylus brasiliensis]
MEYSFTRSGGKNTSKSVKVITQETQVLRNANITLQFVTMPTIPMRSSTSVQAIDINGTEVGIVREDDFFSLRCPTWESSKNDANGRAHGTIHDAFAGITITTSVGFQADSMEDNEDCTIENVLGHVLDVVLNSWKIAVVTFLAVVAFIVAAACLLRSIIFRLLC